MFCRLGSDEDRRPGRGRGQRVGGVDALRLRVDVSRAARRYRSICSFDSCRQSRIFCGKFVALRGEVLEHLRAGRPLRRSWSSCRRAGPSCRTGCRRAASGEPRLNGSPASFWISSSSAAAFWANSPESRDSICRSIEMPRRSMRASTGDQRPLQRLVDGRHVLGGEARLQRLPQPQRHVGVLGGIVGRLARSATQSKVTCDLPEPATSLKCDRRVAEPALATARPCRGRPCRRRAHRTSAWCRRRARCSMPRCAKISQSNFRFCADLEDAGVFQQRLAARRARPSPRSGRRHEPAGEQAVAVAGLAMGERHVAGLVRRDREREAAQGRPASGRATVRLGVDGERADVDRARDPGAAARPRSRTISYCERSSGHGARLLPRARRRARWRREGALLPRLLSPPA